jgi:Fe-S-cluster formation regulator IscX/YfhJ
MNKIYKYFENDKPLIYFTGYGFEDRTTALLNIIKGKVSFDYAFAIGFPSSFLGKALSWKKNKLFIDDELSEVAKSYNIIGTSVKRSVEVRLSLRKALRMYKLNLRNFKIIIDITSFPKSTLFMLLKELTEADASGYLFYTEPIEYEIPISLGVKDIRTLPFFGDDYNPQKQKLLIEILGFEGIRAYAIWETFDPHKTIALIGKPSKENKKWRDISERENKLLLSRPNVELKDISFTSIKDSIETLEDIYDEAREKYNIITSSLGTKLSAISLFYFASRHKNVFIAFSRPAEHTEHQSYGCNKMIIIAFNHESAIIVDSYDFKECKN